MIAAIGLGLVAIAVTMMFTTAALVGFSDDTDLLSFVSALPIVIVALTQSTAVFRGAWRDPKNVPGFGVLLALVPFAMFAESRIRPSEAEVFVAVIAVATFVLSVFGFLAGVILYVIPRFAWGAGWAMTAIAFVLATVIPSVPMSWRFWIDRPPASYVSSLPIKGELFADGPPVVVRGMSYRLRRNEYGGGLCQLEVRSEEVPLSMPSFTRPCTPQKVRCDDARRWCLVAQDHNYATGFTFDGNSIELYGSGADADQGDVLLRICAELLALVAGILLWRHKDAEDRHVASASAFVTAALGAALVVRLLRA